MQKAYDYKYWLTQYIERIKYTLNLMHNPSIWLLLKLAILHLNII